MAKKSVNGEVGAATPSLKLSKMNYRVWSMTLEVYFDSHNLWQTIIGENPTKKKDRQALSAIMSGVPEELLGILDVKRTAKENREILHQRNLGVDHVIQSRDASNFCLGIILFVPKLEANILSLGQLNEEGYRMVMGEGK